MENQKYSVLVVGYKCYSGHLADFIRNLKKTNPLVEISLISSLPLNSFPEDTKDIISSFFKIGHYTGAIKNNKIRKFIDVCLFVKSFLRLSKTKFDIVNIHFTRPRVRLALPWIKKMADNIVISPWGSDVLRVDSDRSIRMLQKVYEAATAVMVDSESSLCKQIISKFNCSPDKILSIGWGLEYVDFVQLQHPDQAENESKARFGLEGRYVITCGYNSRLSQRHDIIIDSIAKIKHSLPNNLTLLFPFTYGRLPWIGYDQWILELCEKNGLNGTVVSEFLSYEDMYMLRNATDMFVHVQTTDASSSCVMQYILCHKKIVHGSWIKYNDLEKFQPLFYYPVGHIEDLPEVILGAYQSDKIEIPQGVIDTIMSKGWGTIMKQVNESFEAMANHTKMDLH